MQHLETDISPSGLHWGENEQTVSIPIPLMTGTNVSHIPRILASIGNLVSHVRADGSNNMSFVQSS